MMIFNKYVVSLGVAFVLAACSENKVPLKGKREDFLTNTPNLLSNKALLKKISYSAAIINDQWSQSSGNVEHHMPVLTLSNMLNKLWEKQAGEGSRSGQHIIANVVADKSALYVMDAVGDVFAYSIDGKLLWTKETSPTDKKEDALGGGLSFDGNMLVITTSFGEVIAVNKTTGQNLWKAELSSPIKASATVAQNKVFVVTSANEVFALDAKSGVTLWSHQGLSEASTLLGEASPAVHGGKVIVAYTSGEYCAFDAEKGALLWSDTLTSALRSDTVTSIAQIKSNPIIHDGMVFVISHGGKMVANDIETGTRQWQKEIGGHLDAALDKDFLFMIDHINNLYAIQKSDGEIAWSVSLSDMLPKDLDEKEPIRFNAPILVDMGILIAASNGHTMILDPKTGKINKTFEINKKVAQSPIVVDKKLIVFGDDAMVSVFGA
ncbi:MAG: Outer membrane protein assembly factor BamB [Holosporales bacterium]